MTYEISTTSSAATQQFAQALAQHLKGGEVIELASDLGGGKRTFVQGLTRALGYDGEVTSPTFTLSRVYQIRDGLELHHYDLYRLGESGIVGDELAEDVSEPNIITVIEWAGIVEDQLPADRLRITFTITGEDDRTLTLTGGGVTSDRLIKELQA